MDPFSGAPVNYLRKLKIENKDRKEKQLPGKCPATVFRRDS